MKTIREFISADIPFARDDANRLLPTMIACLTGFAALLLILAISLSGGLEKQSQAVIGNIQVEVPRARANEAAYVESITAELKRTPGVEEVTLLSQVQMETLLKPWLGDDFALADLPVPLLLDVRTEVKDNKTVVDLTQLRAALAKIDTNIRVEDRAPWIGNMVQAMHLLQGLVVVVALLLVLCVMGMIILVARTNLRLHFKTVNLLHMFGATDEYILRQFQRNNAWLAARGAMGGVMAAAFVFAAAIVLSTRWHSPVLPEITVSPLHVGLFVALPIFTALIALIATRLTVRRMLENMR